MEIYKINEHAQWNVTDLKLMLTDVQDALFFAKLYKLSAQQLADLLWTLFETNITQALFKGIHSTTLQDYVVELGFEFEFEERCELDTSDAYDADQQVILSELLDSLKIEIASSIEEVHNKLEKVMYKLPGRSANMIFQSLRKFNASRPTIGVFQTTIQHNPDPRVLIILDDSGSVTAQTVEAVANDVVQLGYHIGATLALVSNTTRVWKPGTYTVDGIIQATQAGGTHYETLLNLLHEDWDTVITIADYDSSLSAKHAISAAQGSVGQVLDISLVDKPTFLSECVGQHAQEVKSLLMASSSVNLLNN